MKKILHELSNCEEKLNYNEIENLIEYLVDFDPRQIIGIGAGRMGFALQAFIMRLGHMGFAASMIGDTNVPRCNDKTLVFVNSSSGETPSIMLFAEQAKTVGSRLIVTTSNPNSSIGQLADQIVTLPKVESFQMMKTSFEQFSMLLYDYIALEIADRLNLDQDQISNNHSILE